MDRFGEIRGHPCITHYRRRLTSPKRKDDRHTHLPAGWFRLQVGSVHAWHALVPESGIRGLRLAGREKGLGIGKYRTRCPFRFRTGGGPPANVVVVDDVKQSDSSMPPAIPGGTTAPPLIGGRQEQ